MGIVKRKKHDLKEGWRKHDSSLLDAAEERLGEVSAALSDFVPRMEDITDCHRFKAAMPSKPPQKRAPPLKKKTLPQGIQSVPASAHTSPHALVGGKTCAKSPKIPDLYPDEQPRKRSDRITKCMTPTNSNSPDDDSVDHERRE
jgi:hypothetical protein